MKQENKESNALGYFMRLKEENIILLGLGKLTD